MSADEPGPPEERFTSLLADCDEALRAGDTPRFADDSDVPPEQRRELEADLACVQLLRRVMTPAPPSSSVPPSTLGRFAIRRELGRGTFGIVYLAYDPHLNREVALKVPRGDALSDPALLERFQREARAAAGLDHPHIVPVYEAGAVGPVCYIASAYCPGPTLAQWLKQRDQPVPVREAAALVATLAEAVQHAHGRGVVHRDLKPGNILLANGGREPLGADSSHGPDAAPGGSRPPFANVVPRVTDFGLAKVFAAGGEASQTQSGAVVGTPSYMAPEQAGGQRKAVGPAADVYALGAILYELLTGRPPFVAETTLDTLLLVRTEEPVSPSRLRPKLSRDLETVCLKCLEKEPAKRYASAAALAEDLRRFRQGETIMARPVGSVMRAWRWCRRKPAQAALVAAVAVALLSTTAAAVLIALLIEQRRLVVTKERDEKEQERQTAVAARDEAQRALELVASEGQLQVLERQEKLTSQQEELLKALVAYYRRYVQEEATAETERARQALAYFRIGFMQSRLGYRAEAVEAYRRSIERHDTLAAEFPAVPEYRKLLAGSHANLGELLKALGEWPEAEAEYRRAVALHAQLAADFPDVSDYRYRLAASHKNLGTVLLERWNRLGAEAEFHRAIDLYAQLVAEFPAVPEYRQGLAMSHNNLGLVLTDLGKRPEAETEFRRALKLRKQLMEEYPTVPAHRQGLAASHSCLGVLFEQLKQWPEAEAEHRQALGLRRQLAADFPAVPEYQNLLAQSHNNLGTFLAEREKREEAEVEFRQALALRQKQVSDFPAVPEYRHLLARSHANLGLLLADFGKRADAEAEHRRALGLFEKLVADFPAVPAFTLSLGAGYSNYGRFVKDNGRHADSLALYGQAIATLQPLLAKEPRLLPARVNLRNAHWGRAEAREQLNRHAEAAADWQRATEFDNSKEPKIVLGHAASLARTGQPAQAAAAAEELAKGKNLTGATLYGCARVFALASAAAKEHAALQEEYAVRTIALLRQAVQNGFKDVASMKMDKDLDPLRQRADYQNLLAELEAKAPAIPP